MTHFFKNIPILRSFDEAKAKGFYIDYLGFQIDWEHRFEPGLPLYFQVSRSDIALHISEHHGDGTPGSAVFVTMSGIRGFHAELAARNYAFLRPAIEATPWNSLQINLVDPFGNRIAFNEYAAS